jgi:hypothetical protein
LLNNLAEIAPIYKGFTLSKLTNSSRLFNTSYTHACYIVNTEAHSWVSKYPLR